MEEAEASTVDSDVEEQANEQETVVVLFFVVSNAPRQHHFYLHTLQIV